MYEERINQLNNFIKKLKRELIKVRVLIKNPINFNTVKQLYSRKEAYNSDDDKEF